MLFLNINDRDDSLLCVTDVGKCIHRAFIYCENMYYLRKTELYINVLVMLLLAVRE